MLSQKLTLSYGSKFLIFLIQITVSIIVARIAGPTVFGTLAFGLAFVSMFSFLADLGIGAAHIKLISEGQDMGKCISTFARLKFVNTLLFFVTVLGIFLIGKYFLNVHFESTAHEYVIMVTLITVTIKQLLFIPKTTFAGKTEQAKQDIPDFIGTIIYQISRVIIVLLGYKAVALAFGNLISTLLIIPIVLYLFKDYPIGRFDRELVFKYLKISLPVLFISMSLTIIHYMDRIVLQYFANSEQVGYYTAGYKVGNLILMLAMSVGMLLFPLFSEAASDGNLIYIKNTIEKFERFSYIFIMPAVIFLSLYSDMIIRLVLGSQYSASISVMAVINLAMFIAVLNVPYGNVITGMGFFKLASILNLLNLFLFVGLILILPNPRIFNLGPVGVAIVVFTSNLFIGCLYRIFAKLKCPIINIKNTFKYVLFGVINFVVFYLFYLNLSKFYGVYFKIAFVPIYFGCTYLCLFILGWIKKEDLHNFREFVNIRKVGKYIDGEIRGRN